MPDKDVSTDCYLQGNESVFNNEIEETTGAGWTCQVAHLQHGCKLNRFVCNGITECWDKSDEVAGCSLFKRVYIYTWVIYFKCTKFSVS